MPYSQSAAAQDGSTAQPCRQAEAASAECGSAAWPFLQGSNEEQEHDMLKCSPEDCFLHITAEVSAPEGSFRRSYEAAKACFDDLAAGNASGGSSNGGGGSSGAELLNASEKPSYAGDATAWLKDVLYSCVQHVLFRIRIIATSLASGAYSNGMKQQDPQSRSLGVGVSQTGKSDHYSEKTRARACAQQVVDLVASPHKRHMQDLQAMPSQPALKQFLEGQQSETQVFFAEFKDAAVVKPNISMDGNLVSPRYMEFTLSSDNVAAFVTLDTNLTGRFGDNGFLLLPWKPVNVAFVSEHDLMPDAATASYTVLSVFDTSISM